MNENRLLTERFGRQCNTCKAKSFRWDQNRLVVSCKKDHQLDKYKNCNAYEWKGNCGSCCFWHGIATGMRICINSNSPHYRTFPAADQRCSKFQK